MLYKNHEKDLMKRDRSYEELVDDMSSYEDYYDYSLELESEDPTIKLQVVYVPPDYFTSTKITRKNPNYFFVELSSLKDGGKNIVIQKFDVLNAEGSDDYRDISDLSEETRQKIRDTLVAIPEPSVVLTAVERELKVLASDQFIYLYAVCNGERTIFCENTVWLHFQFGEEVVPQALVMNHNVFKKNVLATLSYKDVQRLEIASVNFRKNVLNFDVWQDLFQRDYPEIYDPKIFSPKLLNDPNWTRYTHIKMLDDVSDFEKPRPYYTKKTPPLWKLLYEYQQAPIFDTLVNVKDPEKRTGYCAFYRGTLLLWSIGDHLFTRTLPGPKGIPFNTLIPCLDNGFLDWIAQDYPLAAFECNKSYVYVVQEDPDETLLPNLCSLDDPTGAPVFEDVTKIKECGLIGDTGYYFVEKDPNYTINFSWPANIKYRCVLIDHRRGLHKTFEHYLRIIPCYSTPSETFLLYDMDAEQCEWHRLKSNDKPSLIAGELKFNPGESFLCTYSNRWLVYAPVRNMIVMVRAGVPSVVVELLLDHDETFEIKDGCIVGDKLYLFQSGRWAIVVDLEKAYNREEMKLENNDTYRAFPIEEEFEYVRMTIFGPALCDINEDPLMFVIDKNKIQLVSCQVCQVPVKFMCSLCETPACSKKHLHCCGN